MDQHVRSVLAQTAIALNQLDVAEAFHVETVSQAVDGPLDVSFVSDYGITRTLTPATKELDGPWQVIDYFLRRKGFRHGQPIPISNDTYWVDSEVKEFATVDDAAGFVVYAAEMLTLPNGAGPQFNSLPDHLANTDYERPDFVKPLSIPDPGIGPTGKLWGPPDNFDSFELVEI